MLTDDKRMTLINAAQYAYELFVRKALENIAAGDSAKHSLELDHHRCSFGQWYDTGGVRCLLHCLNSKT
ncbi:hypothetical protein HF671_09040 [Acidithiobacillus thiooxidans]|nr:hypothetical protein [Acidithiobacillus thiooxidans]